MSELTKAEVTEKLLWEVLRMNQPEKRWVECHSFRWLELVEQGWVTMYTEDWCVSGNETKRMALMLNQGG